MEVYSDQKNAVVIRHPDRRFPGILIQGDTLHQLCAQADQGLSMLDPTSDAFKELNSVRNALWSLKCHYKDVLVAHDIGMPFSEQ
ncbi:MAG: hypothetical protein AAF919_18780 [Pseudomonadota bacterium]